MEEKEKLAILKDILFSHDGEYVEKISKRIELLEQTINEREKLSTKVNPIIKQQLGEFTQSIPNTLGPLITAALKKQIHEQKDAVVDALYPILGKMIKKYIAQEIKMLSDKIDQQLGFIKRWKRKVKSFFSGEKEKELLLKELSSTKIEQVFLIEKNSGLLAASYSKTETIDQEMISGMLTAIKMFVEDAFNGKNQNLELIEYELYNIHIQSFINYYVAVVISGNYFLKSKNKVQDIIFNFYETFMKMNVDIINEHESTEAIGRQTIENKLKESFGDAKI